MSSTDIYLEASEIIAQVIQLENEIEVLEAALQRYQHGLSAADHGDPRGYLGGGLNQGYAALAATHQIQAELQDISCRIRATIQVLVEHDGSIIDLPLPLIPRILPNTESVSVPIHPLDTATVADQATDHASDALPGNNIADEIPVTIPSPTPAMVAPSVEPVTPAPDAPQHIPEPIIDAPEFVLEATPSPVPAVTPTPDTQTVVLLATPTVTTPIDQSPEPVNTKEKHWWERAWDTVRDSLELNRPT